MDTQTQIDRLIELAIIQRAELKQLVEQLPQLREHLNAEVEQVFEETEPQLRSELEEWTTKQTADKTAALGAALEAKIAQLAKSLEISTQGRYNAIIAEREENARLAAQAEQKIAAHAASLPGTVKEIVESELSRFPRAGEIDQLRKEFAEPRGLNPRGKWQAGEVYNKLDLVTINGDSFVSNLDDNRERPSRAAANWTLSAARGNSGGGGGITSLNELLGNPSAGDIVGSSGTNYVRKTLVAGANITINETASTITIIGDEGEISLQDGTAAAPSLFFTNDTDTGLYRPAANTLGISVSGTQIAYFDQNGLTVTNSGATLGGSLHAANGNANNPSLSFSGDQDTGFFRHQPNELGITLGGTQYATLTSTTFTITPNLVATGTGTINGTSIPASKTLVVTTDKLSALASTSSSELAGVISDETGSGALVFANTPTLITPILGTPQSGTLTNCTGLPVSTGVSGLGTNVATALATNVGTAGSVVVNGGALGTPSSGTLTNATGLPIATGVSGLGSNVAAFLATPSSANLASAVSDETGTGALVFANTPTLVTPNIGAATGSSVNLSGNATVGGTLGVSGTGVSQISGTLLVGSQSAIGASLDVQTASGTASTLRLFQQGVSNWVWSVPASTDALVLLQYGTTEALRFNSTRNATFAGNLTVNATTASTSTSTGALVVSGGVGVGGNINVSGYGAFGTGHFIAATSPTTGVGVEVSYNGGTGFVFGYNRNTNSAIPLALQHAGGNLLLGTTTDSANGKLQLATHTTSASGIGFGTETSLYRTAAGSLVLDYVGGSAPTFNLSANGSIQSRLFFNGTNTFLESYTSHSLILRTNQTTALTINSSQQVQVNSSTASTSTSTGALVVSGGVGVAKEAYVGKTCVVGAGSDNSSYVNVYTNKAENTAGPFDITLPSDCVGVVFLNSLQSGVGRSFREIPFICFGGTVTLGTSRTTVLTADPVTSAVAAASSKITVSLVAANTNCYWGIYVNKSY